MIFRESSRIKMRRQLACGIENLNPAFRCLHCHHHVVVDTWIAGVHHRNHCPYCLWSKHLDLYQAGDRLAACKAGMQPVALSIKMMVKKIAREDQGELMIVHRCTDCGKVSLNRIAADDDAGTILEIFAGSRAMDEVDCRVYALEGIRILTGKDERLVQRRLLGWKEN